MHKTPEQIVNAVKNAGVIGAGGGGFPAFIKLSAKVDTIIANGSECEPLLNTDKTFMKQKPELIIEGIKYAMSATGAKEGIIAIKGYYKDVVKAVKAVLPDDNTIRIHLLENYYPAGDEFLLVYDVTKKIIPEGGIPLNVGVVVQNVVTLAQIAHAVNGKPVTERILTITGEVERPTVVIVPIGSTYRDLIKMAGGLKDRNAVLIDGGPMMGKIVENWSSGISKTTSGIVALKPDSFVIGMHKKTLKQMIRLSKSACCQCFRCSDLCPRNLIGHDLFPHKTMRTIDYNNSEPMEHITSAFLCSQCGACELIACDFMLLSPRKIFAEYRRLLEEKGIKNPHNRSGLKTRSMYEFRKISIPTVMKKLGLTKYYRSDVDYAGIKNVSEVRIPLDRHAGAPAIPTVKMGQKIRMGNIIAASPADKLGSICHASIAGVVTDLTDNWIEITKE